MTQALGCSARFPAGAPQRQSTPPGLPIALADLRPTEVLAVKNPHALEALAPSASGREHRQLSPALAVVAALAALLCMGASAEPQSTTVPAATPTFSPVAGTYTSPQSVTIKDATAGATIYYTTNGTTPTISSSKYTAAITVQATETLKAIATATGYSQSAVAAATFTIILPTGTPTFSLGPGTYTSAQIVTVKDATAGAAIYYTTNGNAPTASSPKYTGAITIAKTETVEAIAVATGHSPSAVASASYTINLPAATPTFSPPAGTYTSEQQVTISDKTLGAIVYYTTNGAAPTSFSSVYGGPITVSATETLNAIATAGGYSSSTVATAAYTIHLPAAAPTYSVASGTYTSVQTVMLADATPGAVIYYTTNGGTPTTSSAKYASAITVGASETLKAIATATGYTTSPVSVAAYTINLPVPGFSISALPASLALSLGQTQNFTVGIAPLNGFTSSVSLMIGGLPAGVTAAPAQFTLTPGSQKQVTLAAATTATKGIATVTVSGVSGKLTQNARIALTVQTPPPGIAIKATPSSVSVFPGTSQSVTVLVSGVNGYSGSVNGTVSGLPAGVTVSQPSFTVATGNSVYLSVEAADTAAASGSATISLTSGSLSASASLPIAVVTTPDFTLAPSNFAMFTIFQNSTSKIAVTSNPFNGFNQPIAFSFAGLPSGITFSPATFSLLPGATQVVTTTATFAPVAGSYATITMTGAGGGVTHQGQFSLDVLAAPFSMSSPQASVTVPAGSTNSFEVQFSGNSGSLGSYSIQVGAPPSGVSVAPASFTIPATGGSETVYVEAGSKATAGTVSLKATYGPLSQTLTEHIAIGAADKFPAVPLSTADQLVRTDALTPYTSFPPPLYLIYHAATNQFFSTDAFLNQLNVVDASSLALKTIIVPGAFGLDQAPDGSVIYIGTLQGDLYVVDPVHLAVLQRYPSSSISPYGFAANAVYALADGKLLLEQYFLVPGYSIVDGNGPLALWDPATNGITVFTDAQDVDGLVPEKVACLRKFENVVLTNNRTRVLLAPLGGAEGNSMLCSFDPEADTWNWSPLLNNGIGGMISAFAVTSDGGTVVAYDGINLYVLDSATLSLKKSFLVGTGEDPLDYPPLLLSQDNSKAFLKDQQGSDVMDVYDLATGKMVGWVSQTETFWGSPYYQAVSKSGLAAGVVYGSGIGLLDTTAIHALPIGTRFFPMELRDAYGPVGGGTPTSWLFGQPPPPPLGSVYFGANAATGLNNQGFDNLLEAVSPAGQPGPVDVRIFTTNGSSQFLPAGFSYGPWVLESATAYATAEGGGPASLYGFGFGPQEYNPNSSDYLPVPPGLQLEVGGASANVNGFTPTPFNNIFPGTPPLPANALLYTVPAGVAGTSANITVSNDSGSTTASTQITYLPAIQRYPVADQLADGIYDPRRNVYYFTGVNQIRVFSLAQGAWLASIPIPAPTGAYGPQRLFSIALSPDGSRLAVSDPGAIAIYMLNPDQPSSVQSFPYAAQIPLVPFTEEPSGVAVTNSGTVYFATFDLDGDGYRGYLYVLNPATGKVVEVQGSGQVTYLPAQGPYPNGRLAITNDGTRIYLNDAGAIGYVDTAAGKFVLPAQNGSYIGQDDYELVLGANQTRLFAAGSLTDSNLNTIGIQALNIAESLDANYVYGAALSADGSLLFQPGAQAIDVFDGNTGAFRGRISLPVTLSPNYRALVSNNRDSRLVAITGDTGNGIAVIDLNSLPEPEPPAYLSQVAAPIRQAGVSQAAQVALTATGKARNALISAQGIHRLRSPLLKLPQRRRQSKADGPH